MSAVNKATARFDPKSLLEPEFASAVELYKDGSISWYTYASLDGGKTWGIVSRIDCANPYANPGSQWEAPETLPCGAPDWEAIIASNPMDFDAARPDNVAARFMEGSDWLPWWEANFEMAGRSSPSGLPYYRYKGV